MTPLTAGFGEEILEKRAFLGRLLGLVAKRPLAALTIGSTLLSTGGAAYQGLKRGLRGDATRYLQASKYGPSEAFRTNYHQALPHRLSLGQRQRLHEHWNRLALGRR